MCRRTIRASAPQKQGDLTPQAPVSQHRFRNRTRAPLYREEVHDDTDAPAGEKRWPMAITLILRCRCHSCSPQGSA